MELRPVTPADRPVLQRLWQLYRHDLSQFRDHMGPGPDGLFPERHLGSFLGEDDDRVAYLAIGPEPVHGPSPYGFALVYGVRTPPRHMAEFFVVRAVRRTGVGRALARTVLERHPGPWQIAFQEENPGAARFWRGFVADLVGDGGWTQERRPVPGKPHLPPDTWLSLTVPTVPEPDLPSAHPDGTIRES